MTTGTFPPTTTPAAQAPIKYIIIFTSELPVSTFGTNKISACPATLFLIPLIAADFLEIALSKAKGPKTSASIFSDFAISVNSFASKVVGTLSITSSVADKIATFGLYYSYSFGKIYNIF